MKLYYLLLLVMFFLMSCERTSNVSEGRHIGTSDTDYIFEYTIDGHDYIKKGYGGWLIPELARNVSKNEIVLSMS